MANVFFFWQKWGYPPVSLRNNNSLVTKSSNKMPHASNKREFTTPSSNKRENLISAS